MESHPTDITQQLSNQALRPKRIRIGYFSADFQNHATMYLAARLFELHDKNHFDIQIYSYGPVKNDDMRDRLRNSVDSFYDVRGKNDRQVATLAKRNGVDIAVDLKGYTRDSRVAIFANRMAPIQMSWLGYPGSLGAEFIDYVIADPVVIPKCAREHFSEEILYLPNSYQVNDDRREISDRVFTRAELGLPDSGFVFSCFNNNYKITSREFDIWVRLLKKVEGSVLWLLSSNPWAEANLLKEAKRRNIDAGRIVFANSIRKGSILLDIAALICFSIPLTTTHIRRRAMLFGPASRW